MRRSVGFSVSPDGAVMPSVPQYGGVRGEHNVTTISFTMYADAPYQDGDLVRLRFRSGDGMDLSSDLIEDCIREGNRVLVSYTLPSLLTRSGGQLGVRVSLSRVDENDTETEAFLSGEATLYFDDAELENGTPFWTGVSEMLRRTVAASDAAVAARDAAASEKEEAATNADRAAESADVAGTFAVGAASAEKNAQLYASAAVAARDRAEQAAANVTAASQQIAKNRENIDNVSDVVMTLAKEKLPKSGHEPGQYLGTDENGNVVTKPTPIGGGASGVGIASAAINDSGELVLTYTDDTENNVGTVVGGPGPQGPQGDTGPKGPQGDPYTLNDTDKTAIVQAVVESLGVPVFGTIGEDKTITLSEELPDGVYTVRYATDDGYADIGTVTVGDATTDEPDEPQEPTAPDTAIVWELGTKIDSSTGAESTGTTTYSASNYIEIVDGYEYVLAKNTTRTAGCKVVYYDTNKTFISTSADVIVQTTDALTATIPLIDGAAYFRIRLYDTTAQVVDGDYTLTAEVSA